MIIWNNPLSIHQHIILSDFGQVKYQQVLVEPYREGSNNPLVMYGRALIF